MANVSTITTISFPYLGLVNSLCSGSRCRSAFLGVIFGQISGTLLIHTVAHVQDDVVEDGGIDMLGHLHEEEPVAIVAFPHNNGDIIPVVGTSATGQDPPTGLAGNNGKNQTHNF